MLVFSVSEVAEPGVGAVDSIVHFFARVPVGFRLLAGIAPVVQGSHSVSSSLG